MNYIYISVAFSFGDWSLGDDGIGGCGFACQRMQHSHLMPLMFSREVAAYLCFSVPNGW